MTITTSKPKFEKTEKQKAATRVLSSSHTALLEGGGRSGKTIIILRSVVIRAIKYPKTDHLVCRFRFNHAKQAICFQTMPKLLDLMGIASVVKLNRTDWIYEFPNKSQIWIGGLDDKERTEKILGQEYATIYENEASQISYDSHETLLTRLNPPIGVPGHNWIDYNPPSIQHWGYKVFHNRRFPDGRDVPDDDYQFLKMNPSENPHVSEEYLKTLSNLSLAKRLRFEQGEYALDAGKLWKRHWITYDSELPENILRVVVGVDPSGSTGGDEIGIVVAAQIAHDDFRIIDDYSCHGTPAEWAAEVASAYTKWNADVVVAEKNYGGDMVEHTIKTASPTINVKLINSSRGKIVRAEPISALYEHGKVKHRMPFLDLEDEYCTYDPDISESPNHLDAAVFALTELSGEGISILDVVG